MYQVDPETADKGVDPQGSTINFNMSLFESKKIRHNFIKKVYSLLMIQLIITVAVVALFAVHPGINAWAVKTRWFQTAAFLIAFVIIIIISCFDQLRRKHPHNLIILFTFTLAESLMLAAMTVHFNTTALLNACAITVAICLTLTLFALQTKWDFTAKYGIMLVILTVAVIASFMLIFFPSKVFLTVISSIMAVIMGIFLVIDTQMIVGGTHSLQISPEEYVFATINLYLDIINIFFYVLMIFGRD